MELSAIGQISITAHDIDRATAFYRDVLKLKHLFSVPRMAFFDCGGIRLMLAIPETPALNHPSSIIYFKVADIQAGHRELVSRGVHFEAAPNVVAPAPVKPVPLMPIPRSAAFLRRPSMYASGATAG